MGWRSAYSSLVNGVAQTCMGWTRVGSLESARKITIVPSWKRPYPWQWIGFITSLRMVL